MGSFFERGPERRRLPRGGRRAEDVGGFAPLVLLVGRGESVIVQSETVLARLKFAVATSATVEEALRVMEGIRPDVVVAEAEAAARIRLEAPEHVPVVEVNSQLRGDPDALIEGIRSALRANETAGR
jgi:ribosomal protein S16